MGLIAKILEFTSKSRVLASAFEGHRVTVKQAYPPGYEAAALKNDNIVLVDIGKYRYVGVAVADASAAECVDGEVMLYSRNSAGAKRARVHVKASGEIVVSNSAGSITLNTDGSVDISADAIINNISFSSHVHTCAAAGSPSSAPLPM